MLCHAILKEAVENIVMEGLADQFDDALVDFIVSARLIDKRLGNDETLRRIGNIANRQQ